MPIADAPSNLKKIGPLGKTTEYVQVYTPDLLFPVPRSLGRDLLNLSVDLPFYGEDIWNGFELSWLHPSGKPEVALAKFHFPHHTPYIVESKSLKLYLNSFNQSVFQSFEEVRCTIEKDLSQACGGKVKVEVFLHDSHQIESCKFIGKCLDTLDIETRTYQVCAGFLKAEGPEVNESLYSHLLKSNCLATGQPDWGTVFIRYQGPQMDHAGLLKYIISYRNHSGFAEHCTERMFCDIMQMCSPKHLTVYMRYTRRGGLDINPFRSNFEQPYSNERQVRQ